MKQIEETLTKQSFKITTWKNNKMNTLKSTFGALAAGLVLASGCGQNPSLTGEYEGKRYTLNTYFLNSSIVEEKVNAEGKERIEIYLGGCSPFKEINFETFSPDTGFYSKCFYIRQQSVWVAVSNSQGMVTYYATNPENKEILNQIHNNLLKGINGVASNKTAKTQQMRKETLSKLETGAQQ